VGNFKSYHFGHDTKLPENASSLIDFRPAVLPFVGSGYFALYTIQGKLADGIKNCLLPNLNVRKNTVDLLERH